MVVFILAISISIGSVNVPIIDILRIILYRLFGIGYLENISTTNQAIIWNLRIPRVILAFIVGAAVSVSGAIIQSILRNPLASSFTLGVSSGASFGAALLLIAGINIIPHHFMPFSMPIFGFGFGMLTLVLVILFVNFTDNNMDNNTIVLAGMIFSLFINALTTLIMALNRSSLETLVFWQMGSFSSQGFQAITILSPIFIILISLAMLYHKEMDIMTFGEDTAQSMGVQLKSVKWILLIIAGALTGSAISFVGIVGFIDLAAPHIVRRMSFISHKQLIPMSAIFGGTFMALADLISRTIIAPAEIPVGVITAIFGAPFFAYIYLKRRT